jgi:hypothetical protein
MFWPRISEPEVLMVMRGIATKTMLSRQRTPAVGVLRSLFTGVLRIGILRTSPFGHSRKFNFRFTAF